MKKNMMTEKKMEATWAAAHLKVQLVSSSDLWILTQTAFQKHFFVKPQVEDGGASASELIIG